MDTKDLIIVAGSIFFALIIGHGLWVARRSRMNDIRMDIPTKDSDFEDVSEAPSSELPNGGARIISQALQAESKPLQDTVSVTADDARPDPIRGEGSEPYISSTPPEPTEMAPQTEDLFPGTTAETKDKSKPVSTAGSRRSSAVDDASKTNGSGKTDSRRKEPKLEDLLILGVMAKNGDSFGGEELISALRAQDLKFGDMGIFHRQESGSAERLYSVANAVEPGTFDLSDLETLQTPGLTFFMQLPVPGDALETLEEMIRSARKVAATLGGDIKDDTMSALTGQTVEHMKQRIADFARKQLTNANNH